MIRSSMVAASLFALIAGAGTAWAENPPPAASDQPAMSSKMSAADKKAISKSCTDQANAKGLHGVARKKFRSACKKAGGKVE
jgi:hypothetical protein